MTVGKTILLVGGGAFLAYQVARILGVQDMTFNLVGFSVSQDGLATNVTLQVKIDNPTRWEYSIQAIQGNIYANGSYIGVGSVITEAKIEPYSSTIVPVYVSVSDLSLIAVILSIAGGKTSNAIVNFQGSATVDHLPFPVNITYQVL